MGMYPNMGQTCVLKHVLEAIEEVWSCEEQREEEGQGRGEDKDLRIGPSRWLYGEQGVEGEGWGKQQVLNMVQWVLQNFFYQNQNIGGGAFYQNHRREKHTVHGDDLNPGTRAVTPPPPMISPPVTNLSKMLNKAGGLIVGGD